MWHVPCHCLWQRGRKKREAAERVSKRVTTNLSEGTMKGKDSVMKTQMTVGKKITLGFLSVLVLLVTVGMIGYFNLRSSSDGLSEYRRLARNNNLIGDIENYLLLSRLEAKNFVLTGSEAARTNYMDHEKQLKQLMEDAVNNIKKPEQAAKVQTVHASLNEYNAAFSTVVQRKNERIKAEQEVLNVKGPLMEKSLTSIMESASSDTDNKVAFHAGLAIRNLLLGRLYVIKYLESNESAAAERVRGEFGRLQERLLALNKELKRPEDRKMFDTIVLAKETYEKTFGEVVSVISEQNRIVEQTMDRIGPEMYKTVQNLGDSYQNEQYALGPKLVASNSRGISLIIVIGCAALLLGILLSFIISRGIVTSLKRLIEGLTDGAAQVSSASGQVSSASQQLAEGSSEQAAAIEETSASLEEIAAMTRQNAENAAQADDLTREANEVMESANESMAGLISSMNEISAASEQTSKIVKTIDEIAFQTNLLALNAAVEAARAGEAGAGFAVVADEVRNLALRAAEAAKNTAALIEGTVEKVHSGSDLVARTNEAFGNVAKSAARVGELVAEIAAASREQSEGVDQVKKAVTEMDKVVQQNAANAEESASASQELNSQALQMKALVVDLARQVKSSKKGEADDEPARRGSSRRLTAGTAAGKKRTNGRTATGFKTRTMTPEQVIPMEEADFNEF